MTLEGKCPNVVVIEFRKSRSPYYRGILKKAKKFGRYELVGDEKGDLHRILIRDRRTLLGMPDIIKGISGWKHARIICEEHVVPFKEALWLIRCARERSSPEYGVRSCTRGKKRTARDPFPYWCDMIWLGVKNRWNADWWEYGHVDKNDLFRVDKMAIRGVLEESIERNYLTLCPYFDQQKALQAIIALPNQVDPRREEGWDYTVSWESGRPVNVGIRRAGLSLSLRLDPEMAEAMQRAAEETENTVDDFLTSLRRDWKNGNQA